MSFGGKRVLALESRRASQTAELIRKNGGEPFLAPALKEVPAESNQEAFSFAERLFAGEFDMVIFLTGVGTRFLAQILAARYPADRFPEALKRVTVVARGPKPVAALREMGVPVHITAPEPNTWRELMGALEGRIPPRIAVQEYGKSNPELIGALKAGGALVVGVPVYQWAMPDDTSTLEEAARRTIHGDFQIALFTTSQQLVHLLKAAEQLGIADRLPAALRKIFVASIGPTMTEMLLKHGIQPAMEPTHPKLGLFVKEAAERYHALHATEQTA